MRDVAMTAAAALLLWLVGHQVTAPDTPPPLPPPVYEHPDPWDRPECERIACIEPGDY